MARGGKRENAGRKSTGRKHESFYITENEKKVLKNCLEFIRSTPIDENDCDKQYVLYHLTDSEKFVIDAILRDHKEMNELYDDILSKDSTSTDSNEVDTTNKVLDERNDILELIDDIC
jgi:hypothetical protein